MIGSNLSSNDSEIFVDDIAAKTLDLYRQLLRKGLRQEAREVMQKFLMFEEELNKDFRQNWPIFWHFITMETLQFSGKGDKL